MPGERAKLLLTVAPVPLITDSMPPGPFTDGDGAGQRRAWEVGKPIGQVARDW